jgi:hypothetical protein
VGVCPFHEVGQEPRSLLHGERPEPRLDLVPPGPSQLRAGGRRGGEEVLIEAQELDEGLERRRERAQARRARRLLLVAGELFVLDTQQPPQVEGAVVAPCDLGTEREQRGETAGALVFLDPVPAFFIGAEFQADVPASSPNRGCIA